MIKYLGNAALLFLQLIPIEQSKGVGTVSGSANKASGFSLANMFGAVPIRVDEYGSGFKLNKLSEEMKMLADLENNDGKLAQLYKTLEGKQMEIEK